MRITRNQLRQLIKEELETHHTPEDLASISPEEAYSMGYLKGQDMQCDHPDWSPACAHHDSHSDDPDLDDDGFLSVAELVNMVHRIVDDENVVGIEPVDYIDTFPEEYSNLDKTNITKDEAFSAGCSVCGSQARDDCDYKEYSSMVEPLMRAIAASPPEGLTAEDLRGMSDETREELRLQLAQAAARVEHAVRDALRRG